MKTVVREGMLTFWCPACDESHSIPVEGELAWTWNGSTEAPTTTPSIARKGGAYGPNKLPLWKYEGEFPCERTETFCHSYLTDGSIRFCADSAHTLAGQTVPLPDLPEAFTLNVPGEDGE